jgi:hypothetical protein
MRGSNVTSRATAPARPSRATPAWIFHRPGLAIRSRLRQPGNDIPFVPRGQSIGPIASSKLMIDRAVGSPSEAKSF